MNQFAISPEDCLILKAFRDTQTLREAAALLNCDPAGLARKVQGISLKYGVIKKINNRWLVTAAGLSMVAWVEEAMQNQRELLQAKASLRIASTMWFAETKIIPHLGSLESLDREKSKIEISVPTQKLETELMASKTDVVIVCHPPENPEIEHRHIAKEHWVAVAPAPWSQEKKHISAEELMSKKPYIKHSGINEDVFLPGINIENNYVSIDNLIGVRSALRAGLGWSIAPKILVEEDLKAKKLLELPYKLSINDRMICIWWLRGHRETKDKATKIAQWLKKNIESDEKNL